MLKLLDRLGEWVLAAIRFVFVPRAARRRSREGDGEETKEKASPKKPAARKALIAEAVSLHRKRQDVLSDLDEVSREKLTLMAQRMLPAPEPEKKRRRKKRKSKSKA